MEFFYKHLNNDRKPKRANQREILDILNEGCELRVAKLAGKKWIEGEQFLLEGIEAFQDDSANELTKRESFITATPYY